ncbi:hypothetical protein C8D93_1213 [Sinimarinibacterium flocculans]|uniref:Uncharacterized protein n=2 Tax=Sinimarinibacterium flocculans TaxID=985250 RepID=A0A318DYS9_9GAMM|nr:hypothetical protein C8D93_1213 [Sinimarinibacterium flocculans]
MQSPELRPYKPRQPTNGSRGGPWWNDPALVITVAAASIVIAATIIYVGIEAREQHQANQLARELDQAAKALQADIEQDIQRLRQTVNVEKPKPSHKLENVRIPAKTVEQCKAETGGEINEHFARCRRGYTVTQRVPN